MTTQSTTQDTTQSTDQQPVVATPTPPIRINIMFGLGHVERDVQHLESVRILDELADKITDKGSLDVGDMFILRDVNGNRIGVADVFKG